MKEKKSFSNIVITFAILYGILAILLSLIKTPTTDPKDTIAVILGFVGLFVFIGIFVLAVKYYKDQGYKVFIGTGIKLGVLAGLLGGLIAGIYSYIYFAYLHPEMIDQVLEMSRKILEENDMFDQEMLEQQMETSRKIFLPMQIGGQIFSGLIYGLIGGLLGGVFYKTAREDY